jgi:hypothetical protein
MLGILQQHSTQDKLDSSKLLTLSSYIDSDVSDEKEHMYVNGQVIILCNVKQDCNQLFKFYWYRNGILYQFLWCDCRFFRTRRYRTYVYIWKETIF